MSWHIPRSSYPTVTHFPPRPTPLQPPRTMSSSDYRDKLSHATPAPPTQHLTQTMSLVKIPNDTTAVLAHAVRAQSEAILSLLSRADPPPIPAPSPTHRCGTVISERIGCITVEQWDGLSQASLAQLDYVLMKTIDPPVFSNSWLKLAGIIRDDLAAIGFVFKTVEQCSQFDPTAEYGVVKNLQLPALVRMRAAVMSSRPTQDSHQWWVDEVMRIVLRLMELRGM